MYAYNGANQLATSCIDADHSGACDGSETPVSYSYEAYGNLTDAGPSSYTYDAANRLIQVSDGTNTTSYSYDGDGNRISQTVNSTLTTYVLDTATPLTMVLSETSNGQTSYFWQGLDTLAKSDGTSAQYFQYDVLGSVRQLTDSAGAVGLAQTFDPYGNGYSKAGTVTTNVGFTGEQTDSNGFVFLRARYYNPAQGRFFQTDPSRQEQNPFLYAAGNPIVFTDPSGNGFCCVKPPPCFGPAWLCENPIFIAMTLSAGTAPGPQSFVIEGVLVTFVVVEGIVIVINVCTGNVGAPNTGPAVASSSAANAGSIAIPYPNLGGYPGPRPEDFGKLVNDSEFQRVLAKAAAIAGIAALPKDIAGVYVYFHGGAALWHPAAPTTATGFGDYKPFRDEVTGLVYGASIAPALSWVGYVFMFDLQPQKPVGIAWQFFAADNARKYEHGHVVTSQSARDVLGWAFEMYSGMEYAEPSPEHFDFHTSQ